MALPKPHMQLIQGMPLEHLGLVARGFLFLGPMDLKQSERLFLVGYHSKALHKQQTKKYLSPPVKKAYQPVLELQSEGQALGLPHI